CSCTFPSELSGVWYSSHKGALTFNSTHVTGYPIYMSATAQSLDFECYINNGYYYVLKSTETPLVFGQYIRGYLCIELYRISSYKYYYYIGTVVSGTNNDYIFGRVDSFNVQQSDACNRATPYEAGTYVVLVKDGETANGNTEATCADDLLYKFSSITITDYTGASSCSGTTMDGCTDTTDLKYTYAACTSSLVFSSGGYFICMHGITSGSYTYTTIRNNDTTVDGTSTYRFSCVFWVTQKSGSTVYATEYPNFCSDTSQTATSVPTPGVIMTMTPSSASTVEDSTYVVYIITIIICFLVVVGIIVLIVILKVTNFKFCSKVGDSRERIQPESPKPDRRKRSETIDIVNNTVFRLDSMNIPPEWHKKRPIGPIVEPKLVPLPKVEPLYAVNPNKGKRLS
ncbi:hypothetical protein KUTeg_024767, partial [Tegillarca granosa]